MSRKSDSVKKQIRLNKEEEIMEQEQLQREQDYLYIDDDESEELHLGGDNFSRIDDFQSEDY